MARPRPVPADDVSAMVRREMMRFAIPGIVGTLLLIAASLGAALAVAREQSTRDAVNTAEWLARTVLSPRLTQSLVRGRPGDIEALDDAFAASVAGSDVAAVRLWDSDGVVIYADDPRLIGEQFYAQAPGASSEPSTRDADLSRPENRYLDQAARMVQVDLPVKGADGRTYLFQITHLRDSVRQDARQVWIAFAPLLVGSIAVISLLMLLLTFWMTRRLAADLRARQALQQRALDAAEVERRRLASDLHDGTVQDLAGLSYTLAGMATRASARDDDEVATELSDAADRTRDSVRQLRNLLVDIYPPNLDRAGLTEAIADQAALPGTGIEVSLDLTDPGDLDQSERTVLYRIAREALTNVAKHSQASHVWVSLGSSPDASTKASSDAVLLEIRDDGIGFDPDDAPAGHLGRRVMQDLAASIGGAVSITSAAGSGTTVSFRMPRS